MAALALGLLAIVAVFWGDAPDNDADAIAKEKPITTEIYVNTLDHVLRMSVPIESQHGMARKRLVRQRYDYSCGSAALTSVLRFALGKPLLENEVMSGMIQYGEIEAIKQRRGFSLLDMKYYTRALGFESEGYRAEISDLRELENPGIVPIEYGGFHHFVVLRAIIGEHVLLADPALGHLTMTLKRFEKIWRPQVVFLVFPPEDIHASTWDRLEPHELRFIDPDRIRSVLNHSSPSMERLTRSP